MRTGKRVRATPMEEEPVTTDLAQQANLAGLSRMSQTPRLLSDITVPSERLALVKAGDADYGRT